MRVSSGNNSYSPTGNPHLLFDTALAAQAPLAYQRSDVSYIAAAGGYIRSDAGVDEADYWTMDQDKSILHSRPGY